jgi:uncharacterized protein DUF5518
MQPALLGGLFIGVLSALPFVNIANCCCLWIITGGMLAAYVAQQDNPRPLELIEGARIGLRAGLVGALVWLVASMALDVVVAPLQQRAAEIMLRNATDMPPEVRALFERMATGASAWLRLAAGFLVQLLIGPLFAACGGLLGVALFGRERAPHAEP